MMDNPSYEPLFDSKWAIPFVAILLFFMLAVMVVLKIGMGFAERRARRSAAKRPALPELPIVVPPAASAEKTLPAA
jgi:hypothetical protein